MGFATTEYMKNQFPTGKQFCLLQVNRKLLKQIPLCIFQTLSIPNGESKPSQTEKDCLFQEHRAPYIRFVVAGCFCRENKELEEVKQSLGN